MVHIAGLGRFTEVPPFAAALLAGDIAMLDSLLADGVDINSPIVLSPQVQVLPIKLTLTVNNNASIRWLVEHSANLNDTQAPAFLLAARYTSPHLMRYLVQHGADIHARLEVGGDAFQQALYGKKFNHLPIIDSLGHTVAEHAGGAFRSAVFNRYYKAITFFLAHEVNVNFHERDQVFPDRATPLMVATSNRDEKTCRLLVEHGADITLANRDGERPYTIAIEQNNTALADYFKSLESPDLHSLAHKLRELEPYKLTADLLEFLRGEQRRIELPECEFGFVELFSLTDTIAMKAGRQQVLRLSRTSGDYGNVLLVWNPASQCIGYWDIEHEEYGDIATFSDFMAAPALHMNRVANGECSA